jgi:hypothetical protein
MRRHNGLIKLAGVGVGALKPGEQWMLEEGLRGKKWVWDRLKVRPHLRHTSPQLSTSKRPAFPLHVWTFLVTSDAQ